MTKISKFKTNYQSLCSLAGFPKGYKSKDISFKDLLKEVRKHKIQSMKDYRKVYKTYRWPSAPHNYPEWISFYHFFGNKEKQFVAYKQLKKEVKKASITSMLQYSEYRKVHKKEEWPGSPSTHYKKEWISNFDFFSKQPDYWAEQKISSYKNLKTLEQLAQEIKDNGVITRKEYRKNCKRFGWPANPDDAYRDCWKGWDYLFSREQKVELSWDEFKKQVRELKIKNHKDYWNKYKSFKGWPHSPEKKYSNFWKGWIDLCDKAQFESHFRNKMSFEQLKEEVKKVGVKNSKDYRKKYKKYNWTSSPPKSFPEKWNTWDDFLDRKTLTFSQLKQEVKKAGIKGQVEYRKRYKEFEGWVAAPEQFYKKEWKNWYDFLAKEKP
jgi:hypothetical protein